MGQLWVTATKRSGAAHGKSHQVVSGHIRELRDLREKDMASKAEKIVAGLGGIDNIEEVEGCITRLRTEVIDANKVDEAALKAAGAHGVVKMGTAIQVVIGTDADPIAGEIEDMM
ncbi:glucose PTS transporter subunit EIIB [Streptomyces sp. NPDC058335]|uniref:glucose PTS transporter subunit EIIB n=1 Tax=Streptomyces sp. NPDC058335 TaxID=3346451 RepID=UPI00366192B7